jgi:gliding motility-associated-like protein
MNTTKTYIASLFLFGFLLSEASAQLSVDNSIGPDAAVEDVLLGEGVVVSGITFSGDQNQIGSFDGSAANIGLQNGIMLASGDVLFAQTGSDGLGSGGNENTGGSLGGGNFGVNDPDLDLLSTFNTNDAVVLEFDFVPSGDSIVFQYVFGSEEYNEYVCGTVNDAFGFFLSGPGISGPFDNDAVNLAIVPDTDIPVTINTVNNGTVGNNGSEGNCTQVSPDWDQNTEYFIDNDLNQAPEAVEYDGFTVVMTAATSVICGETYHIKMAIADGGDTAFDSGVFLEAASFSSNDVLIESSIDDAPDNIPANTIVEGCINGTFTVIRPNAAALDTIQLTIEGTALNVIDVEPIELDVVMEEGVSSVVIPIIPLSDEEVEGTETLTLSYTYVNGCGEENTVEATINIMDYLDPEISVDENIFICPGSSAQAEAICVLGLAPYDYEWSSGQNTSTVTFNPGDAGDYTVTATDYCGGTASANTTVEEPDPLELEPDQELCLGVSTDALVYGGTLPYYFVYSEDSLILLDNGGFEAIYPGVYDVLIGDDCGEELEISLVFNECNTIIPNVFTPNNDSKNDFFFIMGIEGFPNSRLVIYNRWGNLVFESNNYRNNWDGAGAAEGTYYYVFERSDGQSWSGQFALLRK